MMPGLFLSQRSGTRKPERACKCSLGRGLLLTAPYLMKGLSVVGTGGDVYGRRRHPHPGVHAAQVWIEQLAQSVAASSGLLAALLPTC